MVRPVQYIQVNQYDTLTQIQEKKVIYQYTCRKHLAENIGNIHLKMQNENRRNKANYDNSYLLNLQLILSSMVKVKTFI